MSNKPKMLFPEINFGQTESLIKPQYDGYTTTSQYIRMSDGTRIAADIILPKGLAEGTVIPTLLYRTRYWRAAEFKEPPQAIDPVHYFFTSYGYAIIKIDVRGTGASFGKMIHEWQAIDLKDAYEVIDWIISQPWSNQKVGSYGISYPGTTSELLAATKHPAATSIWATYFELDGFTDIVFPGGVPSSFIDTWGQYTNALDHNKNMGSDDPNLIGVKPVDEDKDHSLLKQAVEEHKDNNAAHDLMADITYRDEDMEKAGLPLEDMAVYSWGKEIQESNVPIDIWGSWMDANTADTVIRHFTTFDNPQRAVINTWSHGGSAFCSPFLPAGSPLEMSLEVQFQEIKRYLDQHFHGIPTGHPSKILYYYTLGEEKWKATPTWPPENTQMVRFYLNQGNTLTSQKPDGEITKDTYKVNFEATTGKQNRWWTELGGGPVVYEDRAEADKLLLVYDSPPMQEDTEITGYPEVTLQITSSETDGAFFAYLEELDENGKVTYITEGMLRALHRKVSNEEPPYKVFGPYHSYKKKDGQLLTPGETSELKFALMPISVLVKKGHRLRLAIAGADKDTFKKIPAEGEPVITIVHNSYLDLPVIVKSE